MNESAQKLITELYWEEGTAIAHAESKGNCEYCGDDLLNSWIANLLTQSRIQP